MGEYTSAGMADDNKETRCQAIRPEMSVFSYSVENVAMFRRDARRITCHQRVVDLLRFSLCEWNGVMNAGRNVLHLEIGLLF